MLTKDKGFYKTFLILCGTLMLEQAVMLSVNLADNLMLGVYSETSLSGVAAVNQLQFVLQQIVYSVSNGMIVLGSQYWGQKKLEPLKRLSAIAFWTGMGMAAALFVVVSLFPRNVLMLITPDAPIIEEGVRYLNIIRFSYLFFAATAIMLGTMRMVESVKIALKVSIVSLLINCTMNYLLISGNLGAPEMGVRGAAIGTLTARVIECGIVGIHLFTREKTLGMRPRDFLKMDKALNKDFIMVSTPVIIAGAIWGVSNALQTVILGHMSQNAIAAQSISSTIFLLLKVTSVGAASAAAVIIGKAVGAGNMEAVKSYTRTLQAMFVGIGVTLGVAMFLIRIPLLKAYNISDETRALANAYMIIQAVVICTMSYQMPVNAGIIRGGGDTRFIMILDIVSIWGIVMPLSLLAAFVWKLSPIYVIMLLNADQVFKCIPAFIRVNGYKWISKLTR